MKLTFPSKRALAAIAVQDKLPIGIRKPSRFLVHSSLKAPSSDLERVSACPRELIASKKGAFKEEKATLAAGTTTPLVAVWRTCAQEKTAFVPRGKPKAGRAS
jgi:hypothetical protein